ncbi:MAG: hypothetical protein AAF329_07880 [Cyanobacteria bacterium P01_A01_bin.17]
MANKVIFGALAVIPSALALGGVLNLTSSAHAFEVERSRGSHGASRIVKTQRSEPQASARRSTLIVRGNHGAQKLVSREGVGGPTSEYKGFPKLEQRGSHGGYRIVND